MNAQASGTKRHIHLQVLRTAQLTETVHHVTLSADPETLGLCRPGQFFNIRPLDSTAPLLRRPISICDARPEAGELDLLVQTVGEGSRLIAQRRPGATLDAMGPLGRPFEADPARPAVMVAGGIGVAPLHYLARDLRRRAAAGEGSRGVVTFCYGARSAADLVLTEALEEATDHLVLATEDGSRGTRGFVTAAARDRLAGEAQVFVCGPKPMMRAALAMVRELGLRGQFSLENQMGCGVGVCQGCVVQGARGLIRVCCDGPVVWSDELGDRWGAAEEREASL